LSPRGMIVSSFLAGPKPRNADRRDLVPLV
jgi:hypothetical protein